MKTVPLEEALRRATPGPLVVKTLPTEAVIDNREIGVPVASGLAPVDAALLAHCRNNLPRLLAAIKAERAAFSKTRFEVHAVPEGSTDEWLAARKETNAAVKMAEEVEA